jgi:hypothetical protein
MGPTAGEGKDCEIGKIVMDLEDKETMFKAIEQTLRP